MCTKGTFQLICAQKRMRGISVLSGSLNRASRVSSKSYTFMPTTSRIKCQVTTLSKFFSSRPPFIQTRPSADSSFDDDVEEFNSELENTFGLHDNPDSALGGQFSDRVGLQRLISQQQRLNHENESDVQEPLDYNRAFIESNARKDTRTSFDAAAQTLSIPQNTSRVDVHVHIHVHPRNLQTPLEKSAVPAVHVHVHMVEPGPANGAE